MSERARGKNHPQDPRRSPCIGSGRNRLAKGYARGVWTHSKKKLKRASDKVAP